MNGYLYVATRSYKFYLSACYSAESLKDYYPDANITLFTHKEWVDVKAHAFDNIVTEDVPNSVRAKMWGMARTPYENTLYIDADTEICHSDIKNVFDHQDSDHDLVMTEVRKYAHAITEFPGGKFKWHCGICLYNNKPKTIEFMQAWYDMWQKQRSQITNKTWDLDNKLFPKNKLVHWDTWGFWRLLNLEGWDKHIKVKGFNDNHARWNFHNLKQEELEGSEIVILHHTLQWRYNTTPWEFQK